MAYSASLAKELPQQDGTYSIRLRCRPEAGNVLATTPKTDINAMSHKRQHVKTPKDQTPENGKPGTEKTGREGAEATAAPQEGNGPGMQEAGTAIGEMSDELVAEFEKIKNELDETRDKYLRLYSEFDNFRKRNARERLDLIRNANEELVTVLLPVLDDFERALKAMENETELNAMKEGVGLIYGKLRNLLEQRGMKQMDIAQGQDFDPELQDAITNIPAPSPELAGKIVDVLEKGYYLNDKVIRFAKVVIGT
jgi:molecular chaperone GrpE